MLIENITLTQSELNASSGVLKTLSGVILPINSFDNKYYRVSNMRLANRSGATVNFALFTDFEYTNYLATPAISGFIPVLNGADIEIDKPRGEITKVLCSGTVSHTSGCVFTFIKD